MPKTILFISNHLGNGGAGRVITLLAEYFLSKGINVTIVTYNTVGGEYQVDPNIELVEIKRSAPSILGKLQRILRLRRFLKRHSFDAVIAFEYFVNMEAILATRGLGMRVIVSERNNPAIVDRRRVSKILRDILYRYTDKLVCQTDDAMNYFSERIREHTVVIPNPIIPDLPIGSGENSKELVTFCRLTKQKNLTMMIDSFELFLRSHEGFSLSIHGSGEEEERLRAYAEAKNLSHAINLYPFSLDVHSKIANARMFLSTSDYEGLSNSMLEAMAMGIPVVCTDCDGGGARSVIESGVNGILVAKGDTLAFSNAMSYVEDNPEVRERLIENGLRVREDYSISHIGDIWLKLLV